MCLVAASEQEQDILWIKFIFTVGTDNISYFVQILYLWKFKLLIDNACSVRRFLSVVGMPATWNRSLLPSLPGSMTCLSQGLSMHFLQTFKIVTFLRVLAGRASEYLFERRYINSLNACMNQLISENF